MITTTTLLTGSIDEIGRDTYSDKGAARQTERAAQHDICTTVALATSAPVFGNGNRRRTWQVSDSYQDTVRAGFPMEAWSELVPYLSFEVIQRYGWEADEIPSGALGGYATVSDSPNDRKMSKALAAAITDEVVGGADALSKYVRLFASLHAIARTLADGMTIVATNEPDAFARLGHIPDLDSQSCYRVDSTHRYKLSPIALAQTYRAVVWYLKDSSGKTVARCWGMFGQVSFGVTNVYTRKLPGDIATVKRAFHLLADQLGCDPVRFYIECSDAVYTNGDAFGFSCHSNGRANLTIADGDIDMGIECHACGDNAENGDEVHGERYCEDCVGERFRWSDVECGYIPAEEAAFDGWSEEYFYFDNAVQCITRNGSTDLAHEADTVELVGRDERGHDDDEGYTWIRIEAGEHEGQAAHIDDTEEAVIYSG